MDFVTSPSDLVKIAEMAQKIDTNPLALAGRLVGLGQDEQRAGIPGWAWATLLLGAGVWIGVKYGPEIQRRLKF